MTLCRTAAQRSSEAYRASLRPAVARWHAQRPASWASEDSQDWAALQRASEAAELAEVFAALGAGPRDAIVWLADEAYAAIPPECDGPWCSDDEHRLPCQEWKAIK